MSLVPPGRAARPEAASSVAPMLKSMGLPASLPRNDHRAPATKRHYVGTSEYGLRRAVTLSALSFARRRDGARTQGRRRGAEA